MNFEITNRKWLDINGEDETGQTMTELLIAVDGLNLTENYNTWSKTVDETVRVSAAPLARWFLESWWRLLYEPYQIYRDGSGHLNTEWRMAHELGAANQGFVWPHIAFISDWQHVYVVSKPTEDKRQSVRYINATERPKPISLAAFEKSVIAFVKETLNRIGSLHHEPNDLNELWHILEEELADPTVTLYRKIEAMMGFDPDEANENIMEYAIRHYETIGESSIEELAVSYGKLSGGSLMEIERFIETSGLFGKPEISTRGMGYRVDSRLSPWKKAVRDARAVREELGNAKGPIRTETLFELLGVSSAEREKWEETARKRKVSVGIPDQKSRSIRLIPRKKHPLGKRFELARFLADYLMMQNTGQWLVGTDFGTARQKYQRAFAAELLSPIQSVQDYLENDFSKDNLMEASEYFEVSDLTVESILTNNGFLDRAESYSLFY